MNFRSTLKLFKINSRITRRGYSILTQEKNLIPRVDLSWTEEKIIQTINQAAKSGGPGFFYIENHGVDSSVIENAIEQSNKFYSTQSLEQKMEISNHGYAGAPEGKSSKGYVPPGQEGSYPKDGATDTRPEEEKESGLLNSREALVFRYPELKSDDHLYLKNYIEFHEKLKNKVDFLDVDINVMEASARRFFSANQWPSTDGLSDFRPIIELYFNEMGKLAQKMFHLFSRVLQEESKKFSNSLDDEKPLHFYDYDTPMSTFNLAHYPPSNVEGLGISDHTDWELFTLLYPSFYPIQHNIPCYTGLEVWFENNWTTVPHLPGTIIVNQGEMLSRFSQGKFRAPVHRVSAKHKNDRISLVSFWAPNYDTILPDTKAITKNVLGGEYYLRRNNMV